MFRSFERIPAKESDDIRCILQTNNPMLSTFGSVRLPQAFQRDPAPLESWSNCLLAIVMHD